MSSRYFAANPDAYQQLRAALDTAWGYPNEDTKTASCLPAPEDCPTDADGRIAVMVLREYTEYEDAAPLIAAALASGNAIEITEAEYDALLPEDDFPNA